MAARLLLLTGLVVAASGSLCHRRPVPSFEIENISNNPSTSDRPCIACTKDGHVALAWSDYATGHEEVWLVEKDKGGAWSAPYNLSQAGDINGSRSVSLCFGRDGTLHAAWSQFAPRGQTGAWTIVYTRRPPVGDWAVPETIWHGTAVLPHIGVDSSGTVHLEFEDMKGGRSTICCTSRSLEGLWCSVKEVSTKFDAVSGGLGVYDDGSAIAAWERDEGNGDFGQLQWSEQTPDGEWSAPATLDFPTQCLGPTVTSNGSQAALTFLGVRVGLTTVTRNEHAPWSAFDTTSAIGNGGQYSGGLDKKGRICLAYGNHVNGELQLARRDSIWTRLTVTDSLFPDMSSVAVDADSRVHLAWASRPAYPEPGDIYYTEVDAADFGK